MIGLIRLGRIGLSPLTISVPILGSATRLEEIAPGEAILLGAMGLCAHFFGFILNDVVDYPIDRTVPNRQRSPLISGQVTHREAMVFAFCQPLLALVLYLLALNGTSMGLGFLALSVALSLAYNLWSKQGKLPRFLAELSLALSVGVLCLSGALVKTAEIAPTSLIFSISLALVLLLLNSVSSGLKDIKTDLEYGARSFVISAGSYMVDEDRIFISPATKRYSLVLQVLLLLCLLLLVIAFPLPWYVVLGVFVLFTYGGAHLSIILACRSFRSLRRSGPLINGYCNYFALCLVALAWLPVFLKALYLLMISLALVGPWYVGFRSRSRRQRALQR
jgi:4-hydroxybenzoate polyprenyltransferase